MVLADTASVLIKVKPGLIKTSTDNYTVYKNSIGNSLSVLENDASSDSGRRLFSQV